MTTEQRLRTLRPRVHDQFWDHAKQKVLNQTESKAEIDPVMAHFQNLKAVTLKVDIAVKIFLVECLHRNLLVAIVAFTVLLFVKLQVVLDRLAWELGFLILARCDLGGNDPESC